MSTPGPGLRPLLRAGGALAVIVAVQLTWQLSQIGPALALTAAVDLLEVALAGGAAAACLHRARLVAGGPSPGGDAGTRRRYEVLAWRFVAAGAASWCAGQAVWTWYEVVAGREVPFPSWADLGYLGFPLAAGTGAVLLARARGRLDSGLRAMLDGVLVSGALLMISWQAVLSDIVRGGDWGLALAVSLAYPIGDLAILSLVILLVARSPADLALRLLAAGLVTLAVADSAFVWLSASGAFATGGLVDAIWVTAFGLIALVAWAPLDDLAADSTAGPGRAALLLPYVPVLIGLGVGVVEMWRGDPVGRVFTVTGTVLVAALLARQSLSAVENAGLVHRLRLQEARLRQLAYDDALTGAANRGRFAEELLRRADEAASTGRPLTLAYIDLNGFKAINDRLGHVAGDLLLRSFAERLARSARPGDLVARLGGDEFAVLLRLDDAPDPQAVRALVHDALRMPFVLDGELTQVVAAVGVVQERVSGTAEQIADLVLRMADEQMYRDKLALRDGPGPRSTSSSRPAQQFR